MQDKVNNIYNTDNIDFLKTLEDNSIDLLLTDFPYGLQDIDALKLIQEGTNNTRGFMNKAWDVLPTTEFLIECMRVLKEGAWLVSTFTPRQDINCVMKYRLLEVGFDMSFSSISWNYCTGFPKGNNIFKKTELKALDGVYGGFQPKPATEIILCCMKPHNSKSQTEQALKWHNERQELLNKGIKERDLCFYTKHAHGGTRLEAGRIPTNGVIETGRKEKNEIFKYKIQEEGYYHNNGRFPANLLCGTDPIDKEELLECLVNKTESPHLISFLEFTSITQEDFVKLTESDLNAIINRIENPFDVGRLNKSSDAIRKNNNSETTGIQNGYQAYGKFNSCNTQGFSDEGDLSRFFSLTNWTKKNQPALAKLITKSLQVEADANKLYPNIFCAKPSVEEKNAGLDGFEAKQVYDRNSISDDFEGLRGQGGSKTLIRENTHPTTKPISLYIYLISIFSNENDIVLDPFCGSGVTPIACVLTNRKYIGIDIEKEYCEIAKARVKFWADEIEKKEPQAEFELM